MSGRACGHGAFVGVGVIAGVGDWYPGGGVAVFPGRFVGVTVGVLLGFSPFGVLVGEARLCRCARAS